MSITTKVGDRGRTALMYNRTVSKTDPRVEACGTVDELNAALGMARASANDSFLREKLEAIQKDLFLLMGELATIPEDAVRFSRDGFQHVTAKMTAGLEAVATELEKERPLERGWATPGAALTPATLDVARTVCRRAERRVCALHEAGQLPNGEIIIYLNRLSDLLWLLARRAEH